MVQFEKKKNKKTFVNEAEVRKPQAPSPPVKQDKLYLDLNNTTAQTNNNSTSTTSYC